LSAASTQARVAGALDGVDFQFSEPRDGMLTVEVSRRGLRAVLERLRGVAGFEQNTLITGVDRLPEDPRFEVVYQFLSFTHSDRVRVRARLGESDAVLPTCIDLWPGAAFSERECWEMFGIRFEGHDPLGRLLMPEAYEHFPLRKDFPHQGIEPDRLYREWDRARRAASRAAGGPA